MKRKKIMPSISTEEDGRIITEDSGTGMTLDTILNVWLEIKK